MLAKKVESLRSVITTREIFPFRLSMIVTRRSWVRGRWYFLPMSSLWIALASMGPIQIGRTRFPSISCSRTTGFFVRSSMASPPTRTGIMLMARAPGFAEGLPQRVRWRSRAARALGRIVEVGSGLVHVLKHPARGVRELGIRMLGDELLELRPGLLVVVEFFGVGEAYHELRLDRNRVVGMLLDDVAIELDPLLRHDRGLGILELVLRGAPRPDRRGDRIVEHRRPGGRAQRIEERLGIALLVLRRENSHDPLADLRERLDAGGLGGVDADQMPPLLALERPARFALLELERRIDDIARVPDPGHVVRSGRHESNDPAVLARRLVRGVGAGERVPQASGGQAFPERLGLRTRRRLDMAHADAGRDLIAGVMGVVVRLHRRIARLGKVARALL